MKNYIGPITISNKKTIEKRTNKKSLSTLKLELQRVFNHFVRLRDTKYDKGQAYFFCISCGEPKALEQMNAGHYWPVGGHEAVRFDEDNVHGQCIYCNNFASGGKVTMAYAGRMLRKIGKERFENLSLRRFNKSKLMSFEVELLIQMYKDKIEKLKKTGKP